MARTSKPNPPTAVQAHASDDFQLTAQHAGGYCGQALKEAREKQGLSIENIAGRLRLSVRQINAIETDNLALLPQASTVRGFIRNYAKELKIDSVPLIEAFNKISPDKTPQALTLEPSTDMAISSSEPSKFSGLMWAGFALFAGLVIWSAMQFFAAKTPAPVAVSTLEAPATTPAAVPVIEPAPTATVDLSMPASNQTDAAVATMPDATLPTPVTETTATITALPDASSSTRLDKNLANDNSPVTADLSPLPTEMPAETPVVPATISSAGKANLSISTTEETWVNIVDANGKEMYSKLLAAGTSENIAISKPLSMTIGNATGATLSVDGAPMSLNTRAGSKVARLKLK